MSRVKGCFWYFVYELQPNPEVVSEIRLWIALPREQSGQRVRLGNLHPEAEILSDEWGNRVAFWRIHPDPDCRELVFHYDFDVVCETVLTKIDPARIQPYDTNSPLFRRFTSSEPRYELTEKVRRLAHKIIGNETNPYWQARKIFDWTVDNIDYFYPKMEERGLAKTLARRKGDCGEFARVFIGLCRIVGIPARMVICNWFDVSGHAWAEFFLPPYGWIPVDPSMADLAESCQKGKRPEADVLRLLEKIGAPSRNRDWYFGNLYPRRLIVLAGENVTFRSIDGTQRTFNFLQPGGEAAHPKSIEWDGFLADPVGRGFYRFGEGCNDEEKARIKVDEELADAYRESKQYHKAIERYKRRLTAGKGDQLTYFYLGQCYQNLGDFESAIKAYKKSQHSPPCVSAKLVSAWTYVMWGICLDKLGNRQEAITQYQKALNLGVDYQDLRKLAEEGLKGSKT